MSPFTALAGSALPGSALSASASPLHALAANPTAAPFPGAGLSQPFAAMIKTDQLEARADQLRRQASDLVESVLTLILSAGPGGGAAIDPVGAASAGIPGISPGAAAMVLPSPAVAYAPLLRAAGPVKAGEVAKVPFTVANAGQVPVDVSFYSSDLVGDSGWGIPARKVAFSPRSQSLQPQQRAVIEALVPIPPQTAPGNYSGVIQAAGLDGLRALLTLPVE